MGYGAHATAQDWYDANQGKFQMMCREAVGCEMTINLGKIRGGAKQSFPGTIVKAEPDGFKVRARSVVCLFKVTLKSKTGTEKEFIVSKLPRY